VLGRVSTLNGTATDETWRLPLLQLGDDWTGNAAVTGIATTAAGIYLLAERRGVLFWPCGPMKTTFELLDAGTPQAIASHQNTVYGVDRASGRVYPIAGQGATRVVADLLDFTSVHSLYFDERWCLVSGRADQFGRLVDCNANRSFDLAGGQAFAIRRLLDGRVAVAGNGEVLYPQLDGGLQRQALPGAGAQWADFALTSLEPLVVTNQAERVQLDGGGLRQDLPGGAWTAWATPSDLAFIGGAHGTLSRFGAGGNPTPLMRSRTPAIRGLQIGDPANMWAVGSGLLLHRSPDGVWVDSEVDEQHSWSSIASDTGGWLYLTDESGRVYAKAPSSTDAGVIRTGRSRTQAYDARSAASIRLGDGGVLLGLGPEILRASAGALTLDVDFSDAGIDRVIALAEGADGSLYAVAQTAQLAGRLYRRGATASWQELSINPNLRDVAPCPDGTLVTSGTDGFLRRVDGGSLLPLYNAPDTVDFPSIWCDADNTAWVLSSDGLVFHVTDFGSYSREATGWGRRTDLTIDPSYIRGGVEQDGGRILFIAGESGAILSRPLP
jgi:hypothetical protein